MQTAYGLSPTGSPLCFSSSEMCNIPHFIVLHTCCGFLQIENPPPAKRLQSALLQYLIYCSGPELHLQYLRGMPGMG